MSRWKGRALELFPERRQGILVAEGPLELWRDIERELHSALRRNDEDLAARCFQYAVWTLHPSPQAKTLGEVTELAAQLLYRHADDLHRCIDRYDFMQAQKGLRLYLGDDAYLEFETKFLRKTKDYPQWKKPNA